MANYGIIIPVRSDLSGVGLQIDDLWPNTSQKNSIYDGEGQSGYATRMMDQPGATVFVGEEYVSGSRMTTAASVAGNWALAAAANWSGDAGHAGNDIRATAVPMFGLAAYLRERVQGDPGGGADTLTAGDTDNIVTALLARVQAGSSMTSTDINTVMQGVTGKAEVLSNFGGSFGSVSEVLRILSGETYYVPTNCIIADEAGLFMPYEHPDGVGQIGGGGLGGGSVNTRKGILDTLAGAGLLADPAVVAKGRFLTSTESGYVAKRAHTLGTAFRASASMGKLRELHDNPITFLNSVPYAYSAGAVTAVRPRAVDITGANIAATGTAVAMRVYDTDGNLLNLP